MPGTKQTVLLAAMAFGLSSASALAGGANSYATAVEEPTITTYSAAGPLLDTYAPAPVAIDAMPYVDSVPYVEPQPPKDGYYNAGKYGGNRDFGYSQSSACGGVLDGEHCLVILNDHMRRVRLERDAGTILVGNPLIADVTVLGNDTIFVSARSIGSTNIIALDKQGNEIVTFEVFVREPRTKRVTLRNLDVVENYQCAPHCLRALTQSDSPGPHSSRSGVISADLGLDQTAIGAQSGSNPNIDPSALSAPATAPGGQGGAAAVTGAGADLANGIGGISSLAGPGLDMMQSFDSILGGAAPSALAAAPIGNAPIRFDAPPLAN